MDNIRWDISKVTSRSVMKEVREHIDSSSNINIHKYPKNKVVTQSLRGNIHLILTNPMNNIIGGVKLPMHQVLRNEFNEE